MRPPLLPIERKPCRFVSHKIHTGVRIQAVFRLETSNRVAGRTSRSPCHRNMENKLLLGHAHAADPFVAFDATHRCIDPLEGHVVEVFFFRGGSQLLG